MWLRLAMPIVASVCALALVARGYPEWSPDHSISTRDGHARVAQIVDDHAEAVGDAVVSALAAGQVTSIEVHNNERVSRGQVLLRIDDQPYQLGVAVAQAELAIPQHRIAALRAVYRQQLASLAADEDVLSYQQRVHDKQTQLLSRGVISQSEFDQTTAAFLEARERVLAEQCAIAETLADLDNGPDLPIDQHPAVERAQAELDQAELDLSHTVVTAPEGGVVTNVERLRVADTFKSGQLSSTYYLKKSRAEARTLSITGTISRRSRSVNARTFGDSSLACGNRTCRDGGGLPG